MKLADKIRIEIFNNIVAVNKALRAVYFISDVNLPILPPL